MMRHISQCINPKLSEICTEVIKLEELSAFVRHYLPEELQNQCQVGSFRSGKLILMTANPIWAMQLRYLAPELRNKLRLEAKLHCLITIEIKVQPGGFGHF